MLDFSSVKHVRISPSGDVDKISIGGVVYWKKNSSKYKIMKDGVQLAEVTMSQLLRQVNSGAAQEDYGIGAQIIVPYTEPYNNTEYELPFNFGTFTAYGEGRLGLQAGYGVPLCDNMYYGHMENRQASKYFCRWENSVAYSWLNNTETADGKKTWEINSSLNKKAFPSCIPEDFTDVACMFKHGHDESTAIESKYFLLGAVNLCAVTGRFSPYISSNSNSYIQIETFYGDEGMIWEYWREKIGEPQGFNTRMDARKVVTLAKNATAIPIPNIANTYNGMVASTRAMIFLTNGNYQDAWSTEESKYLPACVIG